jgi:hypothetical protein
MSEIRDKHSAEKVDPPDSVPKRKRPYAKPVFQQEKVFETMALACGKISGTERQCHFNRKLS